MTTTINTNLSFEKFQILVSRIELPKTYPEQNERWNIAIRWLMANQSMSKEERDSIYDELHDIAYRIDSLPDKPFKVIKTSCGGTRRDIGITGTYPHCKAFCEDHNWVLDEGYIWDLEIVGA